jgi:MFS transporter, MHS family, shikimate and dehydroshikimate transport protein
MDASNQSATVDASLPSRRSLIEAVVASTIGTTIEWYDFFLYGTAAAKVFPTLFFPESDPLSAQMKSFGTFAVGFIGRPVGGILFGYLGDRVGRKSTLVATLLLMGISTLIIGFLPTYATLGAAAPIMLTVLRFIQGVGVGGEWGGSVLLALEFGHKGRRGFYASWPQAGVPLGMVSSTLVWMAFEVNLSPEDFHAWGWRVPFYVSGLLIIVGLLIRIRIFETPLFQQLKEQKQVAEAPIRETIRRHWFEILLAAGARIVENAGFYLFTTYIHTYGEKVLGLPANVMLWAVTVAAGLELVTIPLYGVLSDRLSRRGTYMAGCVFFGAFALPFFALLDTRDPYFILLAIVVALNGGHAALYAVQASLIPELFGTRLRYTGASIAYQLASPLAGGLAPIIATWLVNLFPEQYWPLAAYIIIMSVVSLACVYWLAETSKKNISE